MQREEKSFLRALEFQNPSSKIRAHLKQRGQIENVLFLYAAWGQNAAALVERQSYAVLSYRDVDAVSSYRDVDMVIVARTNFT